MQQVESVVNINLCAGVVIQHMRAHDDVQIKQCETFLPTTSAAAGGDRTIEFVSNRRDYHQFYFPGGVCLKTSNPGMSILPTCACEWVIQWPYRLPVHGEFTCH